MRSDSSFSLGTTSSPTGSLPGATNPFTNTVAVQSGGGAFNFNPDGTPNVLGAAAAGAQGEAQLAANAAEATNLVGVGNTIFSNLHYIPVIGGAAQQLINDSGALQGQQARGPYNAVPPPPLTDPSSVPQPGPSSSSPGPTPPAPSPSQRFPAGKLLLGGVVLFIVGVTLFYVFTDGAEAVEGAVS